MIPEKPYALSCDKNSAPILEVLKDYLPGHHALLEVGAGTGQHAVFMAPHFKELTWTLADLQDRHEGIQMWLKDFPRANVEGPVEYEVGKDPLPEGDFDVVFTANTLHIMPWSLCLQLFDDLSVLKNDSLFIVYGAFNYEGKYTSESNENFDKWIKGKFPGGGIRDFEKIEEELRSRRFSLVKDHEMPANNRMLIFQKASLH